MNSDTACIYSVGLWLFKPDTRIRWISGKEKLLDSYGNPESMFEKMRNIIRDIPTDMLPKGFDWSKHNDYAQLKNPENGSVIVGETNGKIGCGCRSNITFINEFDFLSVMEKRTLLEFGDQTEKMVYLTP